MTPSKESKDTTAANMAPSTTSHSDARSTPSFAASSKPVSDSESRSDSGSFKTMTTTKAVQGERRVSSENVEDEARNVDHETSGYDGGLVLVTVSGGGDFDAVKKWSDGVVKV